ncbi:MAG TPA: hypothetical protein VM324_10425 [Egibacteraceae bacterium]|nr:hypothetical protein [Egibacteraceae bacterium]
MRRFGLTPDELVLRTWSGERVHRYAACVPGLNVLAGETLAMVGDGSAALVEELAEGLDACVRLDGEVAAAGGTVRIQAVQAARVGVKALAVTDPFSAANAPARALAIADLAGLSDLGLTTVVAVDDVTLATLFADRVVVVDAGRPVVAYPVLAPTPRSVAAVAPVADRVSARLAAC